MEWWHALILGIVEGLTEYLPVSSTGHLLVTQRLLGIGKSEVADAFAICIQAGAIAAVLLLYRQRVRSIALGFLGRDPAGFRTGINAAVAFLPAAVVGLLFEKPIKRALFGGDAFGLWPIVAAWFVGGVAILAFARWHVRKPGEPQSGQSLEALAWRGALLIGCIQCIAMWPGVSRSLVTIVGGLLAGLSLGAAVEFSFLLGLITLGAATLLDAKKYGAQMLAEYGPTVLLIGFAAAWLSAAAAVKWMVTYLQRHGLTLFGWYRIAAALVVGALLLSGKVH